MKLNVGLAGALLLCSSSLTGFGQSSVPPITTPGGGGSNLLANVTSAEGAWRSRIIDEGSTEWRRVQTVTNDSGQVELQTNRYTEIADNLNFVNESGQLEAALDSIILTTNTGGAAALKGATKVYFPPTIGGPGDNPITIVSPSNTVIKTHPLALYYFDAQSGKSVLLASAQQAQGVLVGMNQVVYHSVLQGLACDLRLTYTKGAFESDLIMLARPKPPEAYGLSGDFTRLELWHGVDGPTPVQTPTVLNSVTDPALRPTFAEPDFIDQTLDFGDLHFPRGRAFSWNGEDEPIIVNQPAAVHVPNPAVNPNEAVVAKRWAQLAGQSALVESVMWTNIAPSLTGLPLTASTGGSSNGIQHASIRRELPGRAERLSQGAKPMRLADTGYRAKGFVWDYLTLSGGYTSYTFGSQTYFINGSVTISSSATFSAGCCLKYASGASVYVGGSVTCNGTSTSPSVFTSMHDNAFGDQIPGSTGYPTYSASMALWLVCSSSPQTVSYCKIRFAQTGVSFNGSGSSFTYFLSNSSLEWCQTGVYAYECGLTLSSSCECSVTTPTSIDPTAGLSGSFANSCNGTDPNNGLPLSWEYEYFGQSNITASADPDGDGLNNSQESASGTNPQVSDRPTIQPLNPYATVGGSTTLTANVARTQPNSYQWTFNGNAIAGATTSNYTINNVQLANSGTYAVWAFYTSGTTLSANSFLNVTTGNGLDAGIVAWWPGESNTIDIVNGNNGVWYNTVAYAAGEVGTAFQFDGVSSYVQVADAPMLRLTNTLTIEFWVKRLRLTGAYEYMVEKGGDWSRGQQNYALQIHGPDNGLCFTCNGQYWIAGQLTNTAWHHCAVVATNGQANPVLYIDGSPQAITASNGGVINLYPSTLPLHIGAQVDPYYPYYGNTVIDELSLYSSALSPGQILTIYNDAVNGKCQRPSITGQPSNQTVNQGTSATFSVAASGCTPLSYQWMFNGAAIAGATASSYTIPSAGLANIGSYYVVVANGGGSVLSTTVSLNLTCDPPPSGLVSWWRAEGDARDAVGGNDGRFLNGPSYTAGKVGQGFNFANWQCVTVPSSPSLRLTNAFTIEMWYKDTGQPTYWAALIGKCSPTAYNFQIGLVPNSFLQMDFYDPAASWSPISIPAPTSGVFHHLAATYQQMPGSQVQLQLYIDGALKTSATVAGNLANTANDAPLRIGSDLPVDNTAAGVIDEVAIYSRVLSSGEISAIYTAQAAGKCLPAYAPAIAVQPTNTTVSAGRDLFLFGQATGSAPLSYQWKLNGAAIPNATNSVLIITNPQTSGTYSFVASNSLGTATSANATLTVNPMPACVAAPSGLVGWWRAQGNGNDEVGDDNGSLISSVTYTNGMVGQGFYFQGFPYGSSVNMPSSPALKYLTNALTYEFWYKDPNGTGGGAYWLLDKAQATASGGNTYPAVNYFFAIGGADYAFQIGFGDPNTGWPYLNYWPVPLGQMFHHIAASYVQTTSSLITITLYIDGQSVLTNSLSGNLSNMVSDGPLAIGGFVDPGGSGSGAGFPGFMDEVSIYNRALTPSEVASIYNAGAAGKCLMANPPVITVQPASQTALAGNEVPLSVYATGSPHLTYQWYFNGTAISGATAKNYTINDVQPSQAGNYSVTVANSYGNATSANAVITVGTAPLATVAPSGLVAWWRAEGDATDALGVNNGTTSGTVGFAPGKVGQGFSFTGNGLVQIADSPSLRLTNALTVEFWYKDTGSTGWYGFVAKINPYSPWHTTFCIRAWANSIVSVVFLDPAIGYPQGVDYAPIPTLGMFHHIAATYQQTDSSHVTVQLYVDGQLGAKGTFSGVLANTYTSYPITIGDQSSPSTAPFVGVIDEVKLYNRVLTAAEIQGIYTTGASGLGMSDTSGLTNLKVYTPLK